MTALPEIVLVGGGGHCRSLIEVVEASGAYRVAGIVDVAAHRNRTTLGYPWLGEDADLPDLIRRYPAFLVAVGQLGMPALRERLFRLLDARGAPLITLRAPTATLSRHAVLGKGTVLFHQACVNAGARIGVNAIINTAALVEHDAEVGDHCHISTGARVNGGCRIGARCFVGSGAVLREGVRLAEGSVVGAGAVVVHDTKPYGAYVGVPARRVREIVPPAPPDLSVTS
jgi:sugar O-acyltransferase (sialic acid O-acetyltransferase NeuD family)